MGATPFRVKAKGSAQDVGLHTAVTRPDPAIVSNCIFRIIQPDSFLQRKNEILLKTVVYVL
jgi:hypothetical protein